MATRPSKPNLRFARPVNESQVRPFPPSASQDISYPTIDLPIPPVIAAKPIAKPPAVEILPSRNSVDVTEEKIVQDSIKAALMARSSEKQKSETSVHIIEQPVASTPKSAGRVTWDDHEPVPRQIVPGTVLTPVRVHQEPKHTIVMSVGPDGNIKQTRSEKPSSRLLARFQRTPNSVTKSVEAASSGAQSTSELDLERSKETRETVSHKEELKEAVKPVFTLRSKEELVAIIEKSIEEYIQLLAASRWLQDPIGQRISNAMRGVPFVEPAKEEELTKQITIIEPEIKIETPEPIEVLEKVQPASIKANNKLAIVETFNPYFFSPEYATNDSVVTVKDNMLSMTVELLGVVPKLEIYPFEKSNKVKPNVQTLTLDILDENGTKGKAKAVLESRSEKDQPYYVLVVKELETVSGEKVEFNNFALPLTVKYVGPF